MSSPSGAAVVAFAVSTVLSASWSRRRAPLLFTAAGRIGLLRIMVLAHYTSDVLAGAMIGTLCGSRALHVAVRWKQLNWLHVSGPSRAVAGLLLVLVLPLMSRFLHMEVMRIFLKAYGFPLAVLVVAYSLVVSQRALRRIPRSSRIHGRIAAGSDRSFN